MYFIRFRFYVAVINENESPNLLQKYHYLFYSYLCVTGTLWLHSDHMMVNNDTRHVLVKAPLRLERLWQALRNSSELLSPYYWDSLKRLYQAECGLAATRLQIASDGSKKKNLYRNLVAFTTTHWKREKSKTSLRRAASPCTELNHVLSFFLLPEKV